MDMNWEEQSINIGTVRENSTNKFKYVSTKPLDIVNIKRGCTQCTRFKPYNKKTGILEVTFTSAYIPKQLRITPGFQMVKKSITITHASGEVETLIFTAKIIKK